MTLVEKTINRLQQRRENIIEGKINSIPSPFKRFSSDFIGVEQSKYYIISSFTKVGKSLFASYVFLYHTIMYAYNHPDQVRVKILYYPLEETAGDIMTRFMSYLLFELSGYDIVKSTSDLGSDKNIPIEQGVIDLLKTEEYQNILKFFEDSIIFSDSRNPSGIWFECQKYAKENGTIYRNKVIKKDPTEPDREVEVFDHYEPYDPDEYRIIFIDHIGKISTERGMDERQSIIKLSEYLMLLRDRYGFTPVVIQQQNMQGEGLDAFKQNKLRPSLAGSGIAKTIAQDCNMFIGLFSPYRHELATYLGYDVRKLKDNLRFAEVVINRGGISNGIVALLFIGQCCYWAELPLPNEHEKLEKVYKFLKEINNSDSNS